MIEQGNRMNQFNFKSMTVHESGSPEAPLVIFLHGGGAAGWMWQPVADLLGDSYRCWMPDLPGQGQSREAGRFSIRGAAQMVIDLLRAQAPGGRAHLVGLSEGAQVLVEMLSLDPTVLRSALVSSALLRPLPGMGWLASEGLLKAAYVSSVAPFKNWDAYIRLNMKFAAGIPDQWFELFKAEFQSLTAQSFADMMLENQRYRLPANLDKAHLPVLVLAGSREYAAMRQSARDLAAALPNAKAYQFDLRHPASLAEQHNWPLNDPELFAGVLRAWLGQGSLPEQLSALD